MNKNEIFLAKDVTTKEVPVPAWGGTVHVKTLTGTERTKLKGITERLEKAGKPADADCWVVIYCACDAAGNRTFADSDFDALSEKNGSVLTSVAMEALRLNGWLPESVDDAKKN